MCQLKKYHGTSNTQIDKCMVDLIKGIKRILPKHLEIVGCCCGHRKYHMTILVRNNSLVISQKKGNNSIPVIFDLLSDKDIPRIRNFYKRDKQGYYYVPEALR